MPIYSYDCPDCGRFSAKQSLSAFGEPRDCPECGAVAPRSLARPMLAARSTRQPGALPAPGQAVRKHPPGCGCCGGATRVADTPAANRSIVPRFLTRD